MSVLLKKQNLPFYLTTTCTSKYDILLLNWPEYIRNYILNNILLKLSKVLVTKIINPILPRK